jgi:hypothetical protein
MAKGRQTNTNAVIVEHTEMDVLCSKDKSVAKNPGNVIFRERIESGTKLYHAATSKQDKMKITRDIVTLMHVEYGSRFLKQHGKEWIEINNQMARDKVSHALRFAAKNLGIAAKKLARTSQSSRKQSLASQISYESTHSSETSSVSRDADDVDLLTSEPFIESKVEDVPVSTIYMRQQLILTNMQQKSEGYIDFQAFHSMSLTGGNYLLEEKFDTLRSEDLNELLNEPMFTSHDEWDAVEQMAEC